MKYFFVIILLIAAYFLIKPESWKGFYYPDGCLSCSDKYIFSPEFKSKNECLNWANNLALQRNNPADDFECGLNCKEKDGLNVCKETVDS